MGQLIWSPQSLNDLDGICEYIARDSEKYAKVVGQGLVSLGQAIAAEPLRGWEVAEYSRPEIRERLHGRYRVIYRLRDDVVEILTIVQGAKMLPKRMN